MRKRNIETEIGAVNAAARRCGLSYGNYVSITGGAPEPPQWLLDRTQPKGIRCDRCGTLFPAARPWQRFCSDACRKAAYDKRRARA